MCWTFYKYLTLCQLYRPFFFILQLYKIISRIVFVRNSVFCTSIQLVVFGDDMACAEASYELLFFYYFEEDFWTHDLLKLK